jgi:hypothetical protein
MKITVPVTQNFDKENPIGMLILDGRQLFINPDYCFEPSLEKDEDGNWILKEISLVRRKK